MSSKRYTEKFKVEVVKQSSGNCSHYDQQRTAGRPEQTVIDRSANVLFDVETGLFLEQALKFFLRDR